MRAPFGVGVILHVKLVGGEGLFGAEERTEQIARLELTVKLHIAGGSIEVVGLEFFGNAWEILVNGGLLRDDGVPAGVYEETGKVAHVIGPHSVIICIVHPHVGKLLVLQKGLKLAIAAELLNRLHDGLFFFLANALPAFAIS